MFADETDVLDIRGKKEVMEGRMLTPEMKMAEVIHANYRLLRLLPRFGMGLGFTLTLTMLGAIREFLSTGSIFEVKIITAWTTDFLLPSAAPGAFILVGSILALKNYSNYRKAVKAGKLYVPPKGLDCRHCNICSAHLEEDEK